MSAIHLLQPLCSICCLKGESQVSQAIVDGTTVCRAHVYDLLALRYGEGLPDYLATGRYSKTA